MIDIPQSDDDGRASYWHVDRKIPVAIFVVVLAQLCGAIWMFSQISFASYDHERRIVSLETTRIQRGAEMAALGVQLAHIESRLDALVAETVRLREREK